MLFHLVSLYLFSFLVFSYSIESSSLADDYIINNYPISNIENTPPVLVHPLHFIPLICQQQEQYPLKLTRKLCSTYFQSYKTQEQEQQQRSKRVGWTISV